MEKNITKDMTKGSPWRCILEFAVPSFLGLLFYQFYGMVDSVIVGKCLGVQALAAVGSTGSINYMICGFCMGVCNGFVIPVAQKFGAGDDRALRKFVANSAWLSVIFSLVTTTLVCSLCRQILLWMKTPDNIFHDAYSYIFVIFLGIPIIFVGNVSGGIIRSFGDSKTPLYFTIISSFLNIVLDLVSILVLHMTVVGPALATVISQGFSSALNLLYIRKKCDLLRMEREEWKPDGAYMKILCSMGIPMGLQHSITAVGSVVIQTSVNTFGAASIAAVTAANRVNMLVCTPFDALATTMSTYSGQNMGAKKVDRIHAGVRVSLILGSVYAAASFLILSVWGRDITRLFVSASETEILDKAHQFLVINSLFFILLLVVNVLRLSIQGMGFTGVAMFAGVCEMAARILAAFVMVPLFGYTAVCFANPLAWICADLFLILTYVRITRNLYRI
ncbi:MAG: MATE family efflux transporter [Lachnospiraceae bacterium]|nr:MATE family efflux transporter [Lachnospiraceae bacterium]